MANPFQIDRLVGDLIVRWQQSGLPKRELAKKAKLHENTLRLFGTKSWQPRLDTIRALEAVLFEVRR